MKACLPIYGDAICYSFGLSNSEKDILKFFEGMRAHCKNVVGYIDRGGFGYGLTLIDAYIMRKGEKKNELWKLKKTPVHHIDGSTYLYLEQGRCKKGNWVGLKN